MLKLKRSADRKVTSLATGGKDPKAKIGNSFGLPSGLEYSCPGATPACLKVCYAGKLEKIFPGTRNLLMHNLSLLADATYKEMVELLDAMVKEFRVEADKHGAEKIFRIHWDGDFFNLTYTRAWATVMWINPDVRFWTYTRNAEAAFELHLQKIVNLSLYFSADEYNQDEAARLSFHGVKIATMSDTFDKARELSKSISGYNGIRCPEQTGQIPLITANGKGACAECRLCIDGNHAIRFSVTKR